MIIDQDIYLEHFGVRGMKWGVRKSRGKVGVSEKTLQNIAKARKEGKLSTRERVGVGVIGVGAWFVGSRIATRILGVSGTAAIAGLGIGVGAALYVRKLLKGPTKDIKVSEIGRKRN